MYIHWLEKCKYVREQNGKKKKKGKQKERPKIKGQKENKKEIIVDPTSI